jgi:hypothetical protein
LKIFKKFSTNGMDTYRAMARSEYNEPKHSLYLIGWVKDIPQKSNLRL